MSSIAVALKHMLAAEMPHEAILAAVEEMELGVHSPSSDDSKERRRAWDRERKRSAKMRKIAEFPVENVEIPQRVSPKEIPPTPPKEITPSQTVTTEARAGDWRTMLAEAKEAAGETADLTIPTMQSARDLRPFLEPTVGEPCTWDEVLEAIRITGARQAKKGKRIRSWSWIADDAWALRDRRLSSAAPDVSTVVQLRGHGPPGLVAEIAAEKAEARRRTLEMMSPKNG